MKSAGNLGVPCIFNCFEVWSTLQEFKKITILHHRMFSITPDCYWKIQSRRRILWPWRGEGAAKTCLFRPDRPSDAENALKFKYLRQDVIADLWIFRCAVRSECKLAGGPPGGQKIVNNVLSGIYLRVVSITARRGISEEDVVRDIGWSIVKKVYTKRNGVTLNYVWLQILAIIQRQN